VAAKPATRCSPAVVSVALRSAGMTMKSRPSTSRRASASACHRNARRAACGAARERISGSSASSSSRLSASSSSARHSPRNNGAEGDSPAGDEPCEAAGGAARPAASRS
jgi:hypothetical protein